MLFDIRTIIGALLTSYGVILLITGLVEHIGTDVWTGIPLAVVGVLFLLWAWLRPVPQVAEQQQSAESGE